MHRSVWQWVDACTARHRMVGPVLEVGALDVNGSVRRLFGGAYHGVDLRGGPGVAVQAAAARLPFPDGAYRAVVSTEMLEHDPRPWLSVPEMARVVATGGHLLVTCRGYDGRGCFPPHDFPADYWRFSVEGMRVLLADAGLYPLDVRPDPEAPGVFALAGK